MLSDVGIGNHDIILVYENIFHFIIIDTLTSKSKTK